MWCCIAGRVICIPPGIYRITEDINLNNDGITLLAPTGADLRYDNAVQFFIRGNGNNVENIHVDCNNAPYSGFVILGSSNSISGCSVRFCHDPALNQISLQKFQIFSFRP